MAPRSKRNKPRPLEALGIGPAEESVYECLLDRPGATAPEVARALTLPTQKAQRLLGAIEAKGLATHSPERPRRYIPAAPDIAMEALILKREELLQNARARVQELKERAATHRQGEQEQIVELIVSREAQIQAFDQLRLGARREIACLTRPPLLITQLRSPDDPPPSKDPRGLMRRCIVDRDYIEMPGAIETIRYEVETGEQTRFFPKLPLKLVLADHRTALIPLNPQVPDTPSLLVRSSALLEALYALFELLWQHAAPIWFTRDGTLKTGDPDAWPTPEAEDVLALLAAGLNDKTIAHRLGLSLRTLKRRISDMMRRQHARTRFQLAWSIKHGPASARIGERKRTNHR
jgi:DNA-binding CsgD family transcriptional regulator